MGWFDGHLHVFSNGWADFGDDWEHDVLLEKVLPAPRLTRFG
jgi:hypothetical protein